MALAILPGGCLVLAAIWWRKRWLKQAALHVDAAIRPLGPEHYRFTGHDEPLRLRTEKRRKAADGLRGQAAHVDSGAPVSDVLRRVK